MSEPTQGSVRMGRWEISAIPAGWWFVPEFGLKHNTSTQPPSNITVKDDVLLAGDKLEPYILAQVEILKGRFVSPVFGGPHKSALYPADETMMLLIRHPPHNGVNILQVQTYVRVGQWLGIITLTTTEAMLTAVRKDYEQFVGWLRIAPPDPEPDPPAAPPEEPAP